VRVPFIARDLVGRARRASHTTWNGSKQISASEIASRIARWYSPLMSIETARIGFLRSPSSSKKSCKVVLLRPGEAPHDRARCVVGDRRQIAVMAAIGDLVGGAGVNLLSYTAPGSEHAVLSGEPFYTGQVNGQRFVDWVTMLIERKPVDDAHRRQCRVG
jgi:hypothetical protein